MSSTVTETTQGAERAFLDFHKKCMDKAGPSEPFSSANASALSRFEALKFPHSKHEMFTFVNTKGLAGTVFEPVQANTVSPDFIRKNIFAGCESSHLVIVDGVFRPEFSNPIAFGTQLKITPLGQAVSNPAVKQWLCDTIEKEDDVFASINGALLRQGVVLEVPPNTQLETPLQILHVSTGSGSAPVMVTPRVLVKVGRLSELKLIVKFAGVQGNYFVNAVQDFVVEDGGSLTLTQVQADPFAAWNFCKNRFSLVNDSRVDAYSATQGSRLTRLHNEARLKAPGAEFRLQGVSILTGEDQAHNYIRIHHEAPHCTSHQHFKNVIDGKGRSSFDGTVIVNRGAQQTDSEQLINNLLLSDEGHADNKPNLMIFADDVKCTHGATVGQIDPNQLFYLTTRGFSEQKAKELLTKSFARSIIQSIPFPAVVEELDTLLLKKLEVRRD